jgi:hypothetical protein
MKTTIKIVSLTFFLLFAQAHAGEIVLIGNGNVPRMDGVTVQKIYTGKVISVSGINVTPVGIKPGATVRNNFLREFLNQDEEKYTAYWTVRRYIGKGAPPTEFDSDADLIRYVQSTPGAVGYIDEADLKPGMNVIARGRNNGKAAVRIDLDGGEDGLRYAQIGDSGVAGLMQMNVFAYR